jgi:predicted dehydrogenase
MTSAPLRVAIAGLGFGETVHLEALRACPGLEPVALWHPRPERLQQALTSHGLRGSCRDRHPTRPSPWPGAGCP